MADKIQLVELTQDLFCGGAARAMLLDFNRETDDWTPRPDGAIEVFDSPGRHCWNDGQRLWVFFSEQSQRYEVTYAFWTPGESEAVIGNGVDDPTTKDA